MPPCFTLNIIRYRSRVSGTIQGKEQRPPIHIGEVVIKKGTFGSPSTTVDQLNLLIIILLLASFSNQQQLVSLTVVFKFPGLFDVFWPISTILQTEWFRFSHQIPIPRLPYLGFWGRSNYTNKSCNYIAPPPSLSIIFSVLWPGPSNFLLFAFLKCHSFAR